MLQKTFDARALCKIETVRTPTTSVKAETWVSPFKRRGVSCSILMVSGQTYSIKEALKKPFKGIETRVNILPIKVFFEFGQKFGKDSVMLLLKTK